MTTIKQISFTLSNDDFRDMCEAVSGDLFEGCKLIPHKKFLTYKIEYNGQTVEVHKNRLEAIILSLAIGEMPAPGCATLEHFCMYLVFSRPHLNIYQQGNLKNLLQYAAFGKIEKYII